MLKEIKAPRVLIGTPTLSGDLCIEYLSSLMHTQQECAQQGITLDYAALRGDCFIDKSRNNIVKQFLDGDCDQLFFIDSDQGWDAAAFVRLVMCPHDIVAGAVPKKTDVLEFNGINLDAEENGDCHIEHGCLRAKHVGTGFMRLTRAAVEAFIGAYPEKYRPGDGSPHEFLWNVFDCGPQWKPGEEIGQFWGEDLYFCDRWIRMGRYLWIDPAIEFTHTGRKTWKGNLYKFLEANGAVQLAPGGKAPNDFDEDAMSIATEIRKTEGPLIDIHREIFP